MAEQAPTADGSNLPNATPQIVAAEEFLARVHADTSLSSTLRDIEKLTDGDKAGSAYQRAKTLGALQPPVDAMLMWYPGSKENEFERAVTRAHNDLQPEHSPAAYKVMSDVMQRVVCASDEAVAKEARIGRGTEKLPQFKYVQLRNMCDPGTPPDKQKGAYPGTQASAAASFDAEIAAHTKSGDKDTADRWQAGKAAINDIGKIRRLAADLASMTMRKNRWRRFLYVGLAQPHIDRFASMSPATPLGEVWREALGRAMAAHKEYINANGPKSTATAAGLQAAVEDAVWTKFLADKLEAGRKIVERSDKDERERAVTAMWKALDEVSRLFTCPLAETVEDWRKRYPIEEVAEGLKRASTRKAEAKAAEQREAEARAQAEADAAGEAEQKKNEAEEAERQQKRKEQRDAAKAATPAASAGPTKKAASADPADRMQRIKRPAKVA